MKGSIVTYVLCPSKKMKRPSTRAIAVAALAAAATKLSATYSWPKPEPRFAGSILLRRRREVRWLGNHLESSQGTHGIRQTLARQFSIDPARIASSLPMAAGSYGSNGNDDARNGSVPAVPRGWSTCAAAVDATGRTGPRSQRTATAAGNARGCGEDERRRSHHGLGKRRCGLPASLPGQRPFVSLDAAGDQSDRGQNSGLLNQNADTPYATPMSRGHALDEDHSPSSSNLRAPGKIANFSPAKVSPTRSPRRPVLMLVAFRLSGLSDPRAIEVIRRTARMIGGNQGHRPIRRPAPAGALRTPLQAIRELCRGRHGSRRGPDLRPVLLKRVCCAHDGGLIINPAASATRWR